MSPLSQFVRLRPEVAALDWERIRGHILFKDLISPLDSLEKDAEWLRKKRKEEIAPLYSMADAEEALQRFIGMPYTRPFFIAPELQAWWRGR